MKNQRGFIQFPSAGEMLFILGVFAGLFVGVGVLLSWLVPKVWDWVKPWLHAVTG